MRYFWLTGEPRNGDKQGWWQMTGGLPGCAAWMFHREDGIDAAVIFNGQNRIGVELQERTQLIGRCGWTTDPHGNRVELWEPR